MNDLLLLTLVDHAKPFKGTWQIYKKTDHHYSACHSPSASTTRSSSASCQAFTSHQQVCRFTEVLLFHGWSIAGESPDSVTFRQTCAL
ncbi:MAG: hypothetical protein VKO39_04495 [Cyanobacteriota bacterium]|nr:hypothetical protein [Cyanobacteriota bacterium]